MHHSPGHKSGKHCKWKLCLTASTPVDRSWSRSAAYLLWPQLHLCDPGRVHHRLGPAKVLYQALPLRWQAHKAAVLGIEWGVDAVLKVLGRWYFRPLLFLLAKHPQVHVGDSLPASKCPCGEEHSAFLVNCARHATPKMYHYLQSWHFENKQISSALAITRTPLLLNRYHRLFPSLIRSVQWKKTHCVFKWLISLRDVYNAGAWSECLSRACASESDCKDSGWIWKHMCNEVYLVN